MIRLQLLHVINIIFHNRIPPKTRSDKINYGSPPCLKVSTKKNAWFGFRKIYLKQNFRGFNFFQTLLFFHVITLLCPTEPFDKLHEIGDSHSFENLPKIFCRNFSFYFQLLENFGIDKFAVLYFCLQIN